MMKLFTELRFVAYQLEKSLVREAATKCSSKKTVNFGSPDMKLGEFDKNNFSRFVLDS